MLRRLASFCLIMTALAAPRAFAFGTVLTFEGISDGSAITNQYSGQGVTISNAIALTAGGSLNDLEFPPHSGTTVLVQGSGPVLLQFASGITDFGGYFTYIAPLSVIAYDAANVDIGEAHSLFSGNFTSSGNPTNEFLGLSGIGLIDHVALVAVGQDGSSFVADDISFTVAHSSVTPEAPAMGYLALGLALLVAARSRKES